jgi:hypothetical protein
MATDRMSYSNRLRSLPRSLEHHRTVPQRLRRHLIQVLITGQPCRHMGIRL